MTLLLWLSTVTLAALLVALLGERRKLHRSLHALHRKLGAGNAESPSSAIAAIGRAIGELQTARRGDEAGLTRLLHVLDGLDTSILVFDRAGDIRIANAGGRRLTAGHHGDALVLTAARELAEAFREGEEDRKVACLELGGPPRQVFEMTARAADDNERLVTVTEITERRRLEDVRRDFVANISHELRTPIGAIALLTETLIDVDDADTLERMLRRLHHEALRVGSTIDDLLLLSRIESDDLPERKPVEVHALVAEATERVAHAAAARSITIERIPGDADPVGPPPIIVPGDRRQLVSAVYNLLDNAVKYSEDGSAVVVRTTAWDGEVTIEVTDQGVGIPTRDLQRVFERFYRVDRARSRNTGGTGLGLAIVRHVVANHGGEVRVHSREGVGSSFVLALPAQVPPSSAANR